MNPVGPRPRQALPPGGECQPLVEGAHASPIGAAVRPHQRSAELQGVRRAERMHPQKALGIRLHAVHIHNDPARCRDFGCTLLGDPGVLLDEGAFTYEPRQGGRDFHTGERPQHQLGIGAEPRIRLLGARLLEHDEAPPVKRCARVAAEIAERRRTQRVSQLKAAAAGRIDGNSALAYVDGMRWLDTSIYHVWRVKHHLAAPTSDTQKEPGL